MANTFTSYMTKDITTTATTITTVASGSIVTMIGATFCNTSASAITVSMYITRGGVDYYLINNASVPVGRTFVPIGGDQKTVMIAGDALKAISSAVTSADVIVSALVKT